jgi:uncharacterized Zn finger protein
MVTSGVIVHPRFPPRSRTAWATQWWGKAWLRAVEESAYDDGDLRTARTLARSGCIGGLAIAPGSIVASVMVGDVAWTPRIVIPLLADDGLATLVEVVAARTGRVGSLLAGELPHELVEDAEEAGAELLPYGGELDATCPCAAWTQPCVHGLAVLLQAGWLVDADPLVLWHLRGLPREELLARLHAREAQGDPDLETAYDATELARALLAQSSDPSQSEP